MNLVEIKVMSFFCITITRILEQMCFLVRNLVAICNDSFVVVLPYGHDIFLAKCAFFFSFFSRGSNPFATVKLRPTVTNDRSAPRIH